MAQLSRADAEAIIGETVRVRAPGGGPGYKLGKLVGVTGRGAKIEHHGRIHDYPLNEVRRWKARPKHDGSDKPASSPSLRLAGSTSGQKETPMAAQSVSSDRKQTALSGAEEKVVKLMRQIHAKQARVAELRQQREDLELAEMGIAEEIAAIRRNAVAVLSGGEEAGDEEAA